MIFQDHLANGECSTHLRSQAATIQFPTKQALSITITAGKRKRFDVSLHKLI